MSVTSRRDAGTAALLTADAYTSLLTDLLAYAAEATARPAAEPVAVSVT